jgi:hypothetical protein
VIYAIGTPSVLLGMVLGFVAAAALRAVVLAALGRASGGAGRAMRNWRGWLDPFGTVAVVIGGVGWTGTTDRRNAWRTLAVDVGVDLALAAAVLAGLVAAVGRGRRVLLDLPIGAILHGSYALSLPVGVTAGAGCIALAMAILALVPIPPLPAGVLLWSHLARNPQFRGAAYHLLEEQWGVAALLVLLLLPIANGESVILALVDGIGDALLRLVG